MPDSKITALTSISTSTDPANDPLVIVDVSDTSMAATGTTKKVTLNQLLGASGTATLASATITGDLTVDTSTLKVDSANNRVGIGTASPANVLDVSSTDAAVSLKVNTQNAGVSASNYSQIQLSDVGTVRSYWRNVRDGAGTTQFAYNSYLQFLSDAAGTPTERMRLDASGNLLVGATAAAGSASNSTKTVGGLFSTVNGSTASTASGAAVTMFTSPTEATFMVSAYIFGTGAPASYNAIAIVKVSGSTAAITTVSSATGLTISLSGLNVQVTQTSGSPQVIVYSAIRIS